MLICERNAYVESDDNDMFQSIENLDYFIKILCTENASEMDSDASPRSSTSMEIAELTSISTQIPPNQKETETIEDNKADNGSSSSDESEVNLPAGGLESHSFISFDFIKKYSIPKNRGQISHKCYESSEKLLTIQPPIFSTYFTYKQRFKETIVHCKFKLSLDF